MMVLMLATLALLVGCREQEWGWDEGVDLESQFAPAPTTWVWEWELTANPAATSGPLQMVHPHFDLGIHSFLDGDIEAEVDVTVTLETPNDVVSEELLLLAGEDDRLHLMGDLFPNCPEASSCTEAMTLTVEASSGPAWIGVTPALLLAADVPRSAYPAVEVELVTLSAPL